MNFSMFSKLAFIANLAFLSALIMRFYPLLQGTKAESMVLIIGLLISPIANLLVTGYAIFLKWKGERPFKNFIQLFNAFLLISQIILYLFFTGWLSLANLST